MEIKELDKAGLDFLISEEGLRTKVYRDSAGIPTIGIGFTHYTDGRRVTMKDPDINIADALTMFYAIVTPYERAVWSMTRDDITQNQFNALVSIVYNIGIAGFKGSTLLKRVNENPNDPAIKAAFEMWQKPKVLLKRRKREWALYFTK